MNIKELNLEQLDSQELINIEAGGFFYDLGAAAHNAWIDIKNTARKVFSPSQESLAYSHQNGA